MIRLEVWGETPEQFTENAMKAWGLLAIGLQAALAQVSSPSSAAASSQSRVETPGSGSSSTASSPKMSTSTTSVKSGQKATVHSDPVDDLFAGKEATGPTPMDGSSRQTKKSDGLKSAKGPKLDDLKTRLSEVIVAATERWDQKRANAYARKLLNEWRAPKLSDLAADQYEIFMRVSSEYLDGTAAE